MVTWQLPPSLFLDTSVLRMSFVDDDSLSLAGLDAPDFLQLDNSFSSSLTAHCHSSCATSTCMGDPSRSRKGPRPLLVVTAEKVRVDAYVDLSILTSLPLHRTTLRLRPIIVATSSNLFHPYHKSLRSTFQSSGTYTPMHPLSSTSRPQSSLENPPSPPPSPRSAPLMVTMPTRVPTLRSAPNPQRRSTSVQIRILLGQVQSDGISCLTRTALSRISAGILDQNQGVALEPPILRAVALALVPSDAISQAFAEFVGGREMSVFLRNGHTPSRPSYEKYTAENLSSHDHPLLDYHDEYLRAYRGLPQSLRLYKVGVFERQPPLPCRTVFNGGWRPGIDSFTKSPPIMSRLRSRNMNKGEAGSRMAGAAWNTLIPTRLHPSHRGSRSLLSTRKLIWENTLPYR